MYSIETQASGLLVAAAYNWGPKKVKDQIKKMPNNPREKNFWELISNPRYKIPHQTRDYVFYIISAAVIGEDPQYFAEIYKTNNFLFENPLVYGE